jgi:arabinofuranosyltransferase
MSSERPRRVVLGAVLAMAIVALVVHSRSFDFVCDDAFIALREAQNLAQHGAPVYNLGERVEAATSPAWVLLLTLGLLVRLPPIGLLQGLGIASGIALVGATFALALEVVGARVLPVAFVLVALVALAPIAAWSGGGLENVLFAAAVTWAAAVAVRAERESSREKRNARLLGTALALACLVRLEGLVFAGATLFVLRRRVPLPDLSKVLAIVAAPLLALTVFRLAYYGLPLPHTFYAKTSGVGAARLGQGLSYATFAISDLGTVGMLALCISPFLVRTSAFASLVRLSAPPYVAYVVSVGGDFLDLYRFFVPLFPLLVVAMVAFGIEQMDRNELSPRLRVLAGALVLVPHVVLQRGLATRALSTADVRRAAAGIEPLGWTKNAATSWAELGRFLASVAEPGDTMATSAAGAMAYFSGLPNYDLFGLASPDVAREGRPFWNRAGHTRAATAEQIQRRAPTFLVHGEGEGWETKDYEKVVVWGHTMFVRRHRAAAVLARPEVERAR